MRGKSDQRFDTIKRPQTPPHHSAFRRHTRPTRDAIDLGAFSKAAPIHAWIAAIEGSGRQDWYEPLSRRRMARQ